MSIYIYKGNNIQPQEQNLFSVPSHLVFKYFFLSLMMCWR